MRGLPVRLTPLRVHEGSFGGVGRGVGWVDFGGCFLEGEGGGDGNGNGDGKGDGKGDGVGSEDRVTNGGGDKRRDRGNNGDGDGTRDGDNDGGDQWDAKAVERIVVVKRNSGVVYANERVGEDREWARQAGALRALERERARGLSEEERMVVEADLQMLRGLGNPKVDKEIAEIEGLLAELGVGDDAAYPEVVPLDAHDFIWRGVA
jgi:hypothetical protein